MNIRDGDGTEKPLRLGFWNDQRMREGKRQFHKRSMAY